MVNKEDILAQFIALSDKVSSCNVTELCRLDNEKRKREGTRTLVEKELISNDLKRLQNLVDVPFEISRLI